MTVRLEPLRLRRAGIRVDIARFAPSFLLAGYGLFVISLYLRGDMTLYINPVYVPWTLLAGVMLIVVAAARLATRPSYCTHDDCGGDCGCEAPPKHLWPYAALCIPLLLAALFPPRALAVFSANQRGPQIAGITAVQGVSSVKRVSLSVNTKTFSLQDWVGALSADPSPNSYRGKPVEVEGIVLHNPSSMPGGYIMVMRYQVTCCIADARPVGLIVKDSSHGTLKDNQWIRVDGVMGAAKYGGDSVTVVIPKSITPIKAGDPYMY